MAKETSKYTDKKIYITPFGVDMDFFSPKSKDKNDKFTIGTIKTLEKKYGIDYLIKGFKLVKESEPDQDIVLKIAGSGSQMDNLVKLVKELDIEESVEFLGRIPLQDVANTFNTFDIAIFPSLRESFGVAAVEAQACQVPVIVSNVGGHPEVVVNGESGIVIEPENQNQIKDAILKLLEDNKLRKSMGIRGRNFIRENYEVNLNFNDIEKIYKKILSA